jgi:hypothetical protein
MNESNLYKNRYMYIFYKIMYITIVCNESKSNDIKALQLLGEQMIEVHENKH